jgi:hypothetical protein
MFISFFRSLARAFGEGFELLARLPASSVRHAIFPFA